MTSVIVELHTEAGITGLGEIVPGGPGAETLITAVEEIPSVRLVEPPEWELCRGSVGIFNLMQPRAGAELGQRKAANLKSTDPDAIAAPNPGCATQIAAHLADEDPPL